MILLAFLVKFDVGISLGHDDAPDKLYKGKFIMRRFLHVYISIALLTAVFVAGCNGGSYNIKNGQVKALPDKMLGQYDSFSGSYFKNIRLEEGDYFSSKLTAVTKAGVISAAVFDPAGDKIIDIDELVTNNGMLIKNSGDYKILIRAEEHSGSFLLEWNVAKD